MNKNRCVVMFARYPEAGKVKSRLIPCMGEEKTALLYRCFVNDLIDMLDGGLFSVRIAFTPVEKRAEMASCFGNGQVYMPQKGVDLGERMKRAFIDCFEAGISSVLVIGSDLPDLSRHIVEKGFSVLEACDSVIGPSRDGGYYLIGFRRDTFLPDIFDGIAWGTGTVHEKTMEALNSRKSRVFRLPTQRDIDRPDDLAHFFRRSRRAGRVDLRTMHYLMKEKIF